MALSDSGDRLKKFLAPGLTVRAVAILKTLARGILREPLVHFFAAGAVIFGVTEIHKAQSDPYRIVVTHADVMRLATGYALQFGTQPTAQQLTTLIARHIDDEVLFRQGLALGLDKGDEIVRRRVVQKMQFLEQDLRAPAEPTGAGLSAYYRTHRQQYLVPARVSFTHIYFSPDRDGDGGAKARALAVLSSLGSSARAPGRGDPFPDLYDYADFTPDQTARLFGQGQFAKAVFAAPAGHWSGPYRSGYGWHLVYVTARQPASTPALAQIRDTVRGDYLQDEQKRVNAAAFLALKQRYTIVRDDLKPQP